ncbi:hypothetical protein WH221_22070 [Chryseobacterium culicis]|uniref:Uncharacterized protein n=1 Tax=Chryseobacterium culicis TaxID=680127 RepID=A0A2S9CIS5_CHRCI|nr:hypothetical protein [Chryseobacterium culicis]PRB80369.1 hypothetical protein CQ022_22000 [Chryseobacterium culicis]PRB87442.1 hypothetical protein CQ033_22005 [Chryseobacterium culicis]
MNILGLYLIKESIGISDALEHVESDEVIANLKQKDNFYTLFVEIVIILDCWMVLFIPYLVIRNFIKKINLSKK